MTKMFNAKDDVSVGSESPETIIGQAVKIDGTFSGSGNVTVYGEIVGTLTTSGDLVVEDTATIQANIEAHNITVSGEVRGNVQCNGKLELLATARIFGDVAAEVISVETGAIMQGQCTTGSIAQSKPISSSETDNE